MALDRQGALILTCELTFRGVGTPPNVYTEYVEPLTEMTRVRKGVADAQTHPATCLLSWGTEFPHFKGVMESLATTYVEFADDGTPLKAICEIRMLHVGKAKADVQDPESDPTRPRDVAPPTPVVEPKPDETLDIHWPPQEDPSTPVEPPAAERLSGEDDPLGAYLDRVDDALDRLESHDPPVEPAPAATPPTDDARPLEDPTGVDSLEGTLSALEEALDKLSLEPVDPVEAVPTADDGNAAETAGESLETPDDSSSWSTSDTDPGSEPAAEPTLETAPALVTAPVSEPVVESAVEAVVEPVVEPAIESVVEPLPESDLPETEVVVPPNKVRRRRAPASD